MREEPKGPYDDLLVQLGYLKNHFGFNPPQVAIVEAAIANGTMDAEVARTLGEKLQTPNPMDRLTEISSVAEALTPKREADPVVLQRLNHELASKLAVLQSRGKASVMEAARGFAEGKKLKFVSHTSEDMENGEAVQLAVINTQDIDQGRGIMIKEADLFVWVLEDRVCVLELFTREEGFGRGSLMVPLNKIPTPPQR